MKSNHDNRTLLKERKPSGMQLKPLQILYIVCGLIYCSFWLKKNSFFEFVQMEDLLFYFTSIGMLLLTVTILIYNHKYEEAGVINKYCGGFAVFIAGCFIYILFKMDMMKG